jgi:phage/plasmid-associated DNA primase
MKNILSSNPIRAFVETMIDKDTDIAMNSSVLKDDLYRAYKRYCNDRQLSVEGNQTFSRKLKKEYSIADQQLRMNGKREWFWVSIRLKEYVKVDDEHETF